MREQTQTTTTTSTKSTKAPTRTISGAFTDLMRDLGFLKTKKVASRKDIQNQQELIDDIIKESRRLRERMMLIRIKPKKIETKGLTEEEVEAAEEAERKRVAQHQRTIATLILKLEDFNMSKAPDTREIDKLLYRLCDDLQEAYRVGDDQTAHYILETFTYGIATGHKELLDNERIREGEIMTKREKKVETYLKMAQASQNIFQCIAAVEANTQKLKKDGENLKVQLQEVNAYKKEHPEAMENIKTAGGHMNKLKGTALELASLMKTSVRTFKECELLRKQIALDKTEMNDFKSMVSNMEISQNQPNIVAKKELKAYMKELGNELMKRVNSQLSDIVEMDSTFNDFYNSMDAVFEQPELELYINGALKEFEDMEMTMADDRAAADRMGKDVDNYIPDQEN